MKKIKNLLFGILAASLLAACAKDSDSGAIQSPPVPDEPLPGTTSTINAAVQNGDQTLSKVALSQPDNTLDLVARWQDDDHIQVFAKQGGKSYEIGKVPVENIADGGKTCSFNIDLPGEINTSKSYEVYGLCGVEGRLEDGAILFDASTQRKRIDHFRAPLMFVATATGTTVDVKFQHIGAYEVLHIVNGTGGGFNFVHNGYIADSKWYYDGFRCTLSNNNGSPSISVTATDAGQDIEEFAIGGNENATIISWYVPNGGKIKGATLNTRINGGEVNTINAKTSNVAIQKGGAYHLYAVWNGAELKFTDQITTVVKVPALSYRLSASPYLYTGDELTMKVLSNVNCNISVSINGKNVGSKDNVMSYDFILPSNQQGMFTVTINGTNDGYDALPLTFTYGVRDKFDEAEARTFDICGVPVEFVYVKGGTFMMGGTAEQGADAQQNEFPVHSVTLDSYYIGKFEVTRQLYKAVMGGDPETDDDKYPQGDMSWNSTNDFINKLREATGMDFRLPSEAEWEYAARGGWKSRNYKYSGGDLVGMFAHYDKNSAGTLQHCGSKMSNELGIFDMSGNVWEFVSDPYGTYPEDPVYNPQGSGSNHIVRGGGGGASAADCRVSCRCLYGGWCYGDDYTTWDTGLRLAIRP